jgi:hypothetical protein
VIFQIEMTHHPLHQQYIEQQLQQDFPTIEVWEILDQPQYFLQRILEPVRLPSYEQILEDETFNLHIYQSRIVWVTRNDENRINAGLIFDINLQIGMGAIQPKHIKMRLLGVKELKDFAREELQKQEEGLEYQIQILRQKYKEKQQPYNNLLHNLKRRFR